MARFGNTTFRGLFRSPLGGMTSRLRLGHVTTVPFLPLYLPHATPQMRPQYITSSILWQLIEETTIVMCPAGGNFIHLLELPTPGLTYNRHHVGPFIRHICSYI